MPTDNAEITALENRFWQSMVDKDSEAGAAMMADEALITGAHGTMKIDPAKFAKMTEEGQWMLEKYAFSDVEVIFPSDDVAVIAYKVRQSGEMKGEKMDMQCADSTTWVRDGDDWKCALHTETILGEPPKG